jgi:hypothetical protein
MKVGYLPNNVINVPESELFMLPGLTAKFDACRIAGLTVSRIDYRDFIMIEKSQFADDLVDVFVYNRVPFYCIFSNYDVDEKVGQVRYHLRAQAVLRLARSLWLLKEGTLYNPLQFIHYKRTGSLNQRDPNSFGRLAYALKSEYELSREELPVLEGIYYALACFDDARNSREIEIAEQLFIATYNPALTAPTEKFLLLLGSLEALVEDRVERLVKARWLTREQRKLLEQFRRYRNGIAHGKQTLSGDEQVKTLRDIVRCLLRQAFVRILQDPTGENVVGDKLIDDLMQLGTVNAEQLATVETKYSTLVS